MLSFAAYSFSQSVIDNVNGNVGIGTITPGYKLDVAGSINISAGNQFLINGEALTSSQWVNSASVSNAIYYNQGNVGIGNTSPLASLDIYADDNTPAFAVKNGLTGADINFLIYGDGRVYSREINVEMDAFPDYVFNNNYDLMSIKKLEEYINANKHLPDVPSAEQVSKKGVDLGAMNSLLLKKIEEMTLYIIKLNNEMEILKKQVNKN